MLCISVIIYRLSNDYKNQSTVLYRKPNERCMNENINMIIDEYNNNL